MFQIEKDNFFKLFCLILILLFSNIKTTFSNEKKEILDIKPYCKGSFYYAPKELNSLKTLPKQIEIQFTKSGKWYQNLFSLIQYLGNPKYKHTKKIPKKYKKYSSVNIIVEYPNKKKCKFKGKARIHGGRGDHVSNDDFITSLRVKISNGNINNINNFILFLPKARNNDDEIFTTHLLKKLNILSPFSMNVDVKINESKFSKFIFQEKIDADFLNRNRKLDGMILASNRSPQISEVINNFDGAFDRLSFIAENFSSSEKDIHNGVNNLNYFLIQNYILNKESSYNKKIIKGETLLTSIMSLNKKFNRIKEENFLIFNTLMISLGGSHALTLHDIKYYYDNFYNTMEPIYYDGQTRILQKYDLSKDFEFTGKVLDTHKKGAKILLKRLENIDIESFRKDLISRNIDIENLDISLTFQLINKNLKTIINSKILPINNFDPNKLNFVFFNNDKDENIHLTFGGKNNILNICNKKLDNCQEQLITNKLLNRILSKQITKFDDKNLFYVGQSVNGFKKRLIPEKYGIELLTRIEFNKINDIYYKFKDTKININEDLKQIDISVFNNKERIIFIAKNLNNWKINYSNINILSKKFKKSTIKSNFPSGCVSFLDSNVRGLKIKIENSDCPDALNFVKSKGHISEVEIDNSAYDGLDADYSELNFDKITINNTNQECVGFKSGSYTVKFADLRNCGDKGFSNGEISTVVINDILIEDSKNGVISKDTSEIYIDKYDFNNISNLCLGAYKGKKNFTGSKIKIKNMLNNCDDQFKVVQDGSYIEILNNEF